MPNCRNCGARITKFDKDICPICGCKRPIDEKAEETIDITSQIDLKSKDFKNYKPKKRNVAFTLSILLGFSGAPFFYIKKNLIGLLSLIFNIVIILIFGLALWLGAKIDPLISFVLIGLGTDYLINICFSFYFLIKNDLKDNEGNFLR